MIVQIVYIVLEFGKQQYSDNIIVDMAALVFIVWYTLIHFGLP